MYADILYSDQRVKSQLMPQWLLNKSLLLFDSVGIAT